MDWEAYRKLSVARRLRQSQGPGFYVDLKPALLAPLEALIAPLRSDRPRFRRYEEQLALA